MSKQFREMSDEELRAKVVSATAWGAALAQASKWRDQCERLLHDRGLIVELDLSIRSTPPGMSAKQEKTDGTDTR